MFIQNPVLKLNMWTTQTNIPFNSQYITMVDSDISWKNHIVLIDICRKIDLFTDTAAILNSIVLTEKLWAAEGAIAGKFIVYIAFRINFYCLSLIFHNKYYKRYIFPSRYLPVVPMVIEKLLLKVITPQYSF